MVCAYLHPHATQLLNAIEELPKSRRIAVRAVILTATGAAFGVYYQTIYSLPKVEYNKVRVTLLVCAPASDKPVTQQPLPRAYGTRLG
jgi:hypothetical protein